MKKCKRLLKSKKGYTLVEVITAMAVMAIFSGALYTLFFSGGQTYQVVHDSYKAQNEARIAMSYIAVKIRQNDAVSSGPTGVVRNVKAVDTGTRTELIIKHIKSDGSSEFYKIYHDGAGKLMEKIAPSESTLDTADAQEIATVEGTTFEAENGGGRIKITVSYRDKAGAPLRSLVETITLRSDGA